MDFLLDALTEWLKEMLVGGIMGNLSGMFDSVNQQVGDISVQVGQTIQIPVYAETCVLLDDLMAGGWYA